EDQCEGALRHAEGTPHRRPRDAHQRVRQSDTDERQVRDDEEKPGGRVGTGRWRHSLSASPHGWLYRCGTSLPLWRVKSLVKLRLLDNLVVLQPRFAVASGPSRVHG